MNEFCTARAHQSHSRTTNECENTLFALDKKRVTVERKVRAARGGEQSRTL